MAIYHLEAKVVSRGTGRSAVAAAAYLSCSKILNDYDGIQHDYTRKKGLVWQEVYWSSFLVTLCSEIMLYIETPLVSYSYSLNEVSHSCTS